MRRCGVPETGDGGPVPGSILNDCLAAHDRARRARAQVSHMLLRAQSLRRSADAILAHGDRPWPESAALEALRSN